MIAKKSDWYKSIWSLDIKNDCWVEDTIRQTDFIIEALDLRKNHRILDLACGFGRHSLELAKRGFEVVGVDITRDYIIDAENSAKKEGLSAQFILSDIRDLQFDQEFDAVLNLADGAIGYLENDKENLKIFDVIANALKPGGNILWIYAMQNMQNRIFLQPVGKPAQQPSPSLSLSGTARRKLCSTAVKPSLMEIPWSNRKSFLVIPSGFIPIRNWMGS